jgi:microcystin-dependent protein
MAFNGSGVHNRVHDWTQDLTNTIPVTASRMDAEHDDISASLSALICRDGQSTTTARIPFAQGTSAFGGAASSVSYAQINDPNTGLYFPAPDQWGLVAGGTAVLTGTSSALTLTGNFSVSGTSDIVGNATVGGTFAAAGDITHHGQPIVPIGAVMDYAGASAPNGWLFCYGQAVSRTTYSALFAALSTTYGSGDGSTTFNLPDYRGRVLAGKDDMGGTSANRLTNQSGGLNGDTLGTTGGSETHTLIVAQIPANLTVDVTAITDSITVITGNNGAVAVRSDLTTTPVQSVLNSGSLESALSGAITVGGGGTAHNNVQPTIVANKIIYTGVYS